MIRCPSSVRHRAIADYGSISDTSMSACRWHRDRRNYWRHCSPAHRHRLQRRHSARPGFACSHLPPQHQRASIMPNQPQSAAHQKFDIVIIGGAMMGSAAAWFLSHHPQFDGRILVIERDPSYAFCSTSHTHSCLRQQYSSPLNIKLRNLLWIWCGVLSII